MQRLSGGFGGSCVVHLGVGALRLPPVVNRSVGLTPSNGVGIDAVVEAPEWVDVGRRHVGIPAVVRGGFDR